MFCPKKEVRLLQLTNRRSLDSRCARYIRFNAQWERSYIFYAGPRKLLIKESKYKHIMSLLTIFRYLLESCLTGNENSMVAFGLAATGTLSMAFVVYEHHMYQKYLP